MQSTRVLQPLPLYNIGKACPGLAHPELFPMLHHGCHTRVCSVFKAIASRHCRCLGSAIIVTSAALDALSVDVDQLPAGWTGQWQMRMRSEHL